ncbi:uncharacterized protein Z519_11426 [Cladophialophora bantiana CBS 173.52]|uniref:SCP domain-containing protein n=1 Tax=Cladophialophora bantiana (strain ATCC 10958 / CBS 173.52 / CDC B-1940 / NIH 8579) TaxID=1442370 RepID=A0A0D2FMA4_CLAB1|nr:uncharacterized protein Z519_11426 [Cladophialophora bantiana CBS 173.52]KIW87842.1 hypothetical protein Z519_11426 [Cladophialophora bantiana CBS 173.52]
MKFPTTTLVVLAVIGQTLGSWIDWFGDVTLTETATRIIQSCPCNGEVRATPVARGQDVQIFPRPGPPFGPRFPIPAGRTVTKAGPIVAVYSTAGAMTTKTGIVIELEPTRGGQGPRLTTTIWTSPQPTSDLVWIDWTPEDGKDGASLTRTRTKFTTIYGPAPTNAELEPWVDWFEPPHTKTSTSRSSSSSSNVAPIDSSTGSSAPAYGYPTRPSGSSSTSVPTTSSSSSSGGAGPTGGSTSSGSSSPSSSSTSAFSSSIGGSTTSSSSFTSASLSMSTSSSGATTSSLSSTGISSTTQSDPSSNGGSPVAESTTTTSNTSGSSFTSSSSTSLASSSITSLSSVSVGSTSGAASSMVTLATSSSISGTSSSISASSSAVGSTTSSSSSAPSGTSRSSSSLSTTYTSSTSGTILSTTISTVSWATTSAFSSTTLLSTTSFLISTITAVAEGAVMTDDVRSLSYNDAILQAHNVHRRNHSAADLTWSDNLATIAAQIAASCVYAHNTAAGGGGYGQNIGAGYTTTQVPAMIGNDMYNKEMPNYPLPYEVDNVDTSKFDSWGHFSQIVWKRTQQVGCATQFCPDGVVNADFTQYFTVCNYYPPGNIQGAYSNVGAPLGQPLTVELTN